MKRSHLLIGILVGLHIVLAALILWRYAAEKEGDQWQMFTLFAVSASQGNLLGFWTALCGKRTPWRVVTATVGIVIYVIICDRLGGGNGDLGQMLAQVVAWTTVTVGVLLLVARLARLRLQRAGSARVEEELGRFQFSLWQMLVWTTVLAVILSSLHYLPDNLRPGFQFDPALALGLLWLGGLALASVWLAFGKRWLVARVTLLIVVTIVGTAATASSSSTGSPSVNHFVCLCLLLLAEPVLTTASLLVVRLAGYQLTWR